MALIRQEPPNGGIECKDGMKKWRFSTNISLYLRNDYSHVSRLDVWQAVIIGPVVVSLPSRGRDSAYASVIT